MPTRTQCVLLTLLQAARRFRYCSFVGDELITDPQAFLRSSYVGRIYCSSAIRQSRPVDLGAVSGDTGVPGEGTAPVQRDPGRP